MRTRWRAISGSGGLVYDDQIEKFRRVNPDEFTPICADLDRHSFHKGTLKPRLSLPRQSLLLAPLPRQTALRATMLLTFSVIGDLEKNRVFLPRNR